ncbi:MAG: cation-transporting P-type ATPase, partial [Brachybacterium sp.]|nr:cation-transporting P-type ATPase [Brachybacterium sp.]
MSDDCCGPVTTAPPPVPHVEDACCDSAAPAAPDETLELEDRTPWWRDRSLALPLAAGVLWVAGLLLAWAGLDLAGLVVHTLALAAGAWTFVPGTLRRLVQGRGLTRLGVGLLMTLAALGAVLLGHVGEAAALAFLFSLAEALEDRSMDRAKQGLRSLLALIPETARVSRPTGPEIVPAAELRTGDLLLLGAGDRVATDGVIVD